MLSKKLLVIGSVVLVLAVGGAGGFVYMQKANAATELDEDEASGSAKVEHTVANKEAPVYVPLESLVANVKDASGIRMAQMSITLVVDNAKTQERVKQFIPGIRSGLLLLVSDYSGDELLSREGKERLKKDIANVVRKAMGLPLENTLQEGDGLDENEEVVATKGKGSKKEPRKKKAPSPIQDVLFSSFIVQQ